MKQATAGLVAVGLVLATAVLASAQPSTRPSLVIGGDGARVLCMSNQIAQVVQVSAGAVDIVCAPGPAVGPHYITLVAPSTAKVFCGKAGGPMNRGVLRDRHVRPDFIDVDCR